MKLGFLGLGNMGGAIAANLLKAGHEVTVWNRSADKAKALVAAGAHRAATPAEAAQGDAVLTMLANDEAVERVVFGADGILQARTSALHVSLSTISVALAQRLTEAHGANSFVSAPVFGRPAAAAAKQLFIVAAGPPEVLARCQPLFAAIGQRTFVVGEAPQQANVVKLCGNFMIMCAIEAMAEAMTLAGKSGVDKATVLDVLTGTLFGAPIYKIYGEIILAGRYQPAGFAVALGLKDMNLADAASLAAKAPMPFLNLLRGQLLTTIARYGDDLDWSAIARTVEENAASLSD